jgi:predicted nucleic-acid-binding Zn-ribbon protein
MYIDEPKKEEKQIKSFLKPFLKQKIMTNRQQYTIDEKLSNMDLYGLSCRVPKPTPEQEKCSHSKIVERDLGFENWMTGEWVSDIQYVEDDTYEDIPRTNNFRCTQCGYTRRY